MTYTLNLPAGAGIHPVFHISQLKGKVPNQQEAVTELPVKRSIAILDRKMVKRGNKAATKWLVQWEGGTEREPLGNLLFIYRGNIRK